MFDDPKKELQRLEEQLLAAEQEQWDQPGAEQEPEELPEPEAGGRFLRQEDSAPPQEPEEEAATGRSGSRVPILVALLLLEVAALFAVLAWWVLWK